MFDLTLILSPCASASIITTLLGLTSVYIKFEGKKTMVSSKLYVIAV